MNEITVIKPRDSELLRNVRDKFVPDHGQAYYKSFLSQLADRLESEQQEIEDLEELARMRAGTIGLWKEDYADLKKEYERRIADGELIPIDIAIQWATEVPFGSKTLQQFAKENAKK